MGPEVTGEAQAVVPAEAGEALVARSGSTVTSAVSVRFRLSVTRSCKVIDPELGATTVAVVRRRSEPALFAVESLDGLEALEASIRGPAT